MKSLNFTPEEAEARIAKTKNVEIASNMGFLNAHNGLRRGCTHILMGTSGGGKTTLVRTLIRDFLFKKENKDLGISIQLSEETCEEYKTQLVFGMPPHEALDRGAILSEQEHQDESFDYFLDCHRSIAPDLIIYDNMTTSKFYEGQSTKDQGALFTKIKNLTKELKCATIVVAHSGAEVNDGLDRLMNQNDIRGSKTIPNMAEFFYIMQRFKHGNVHFPTIRTVKHRGQDLVHNMYFLHYEESTRTYIKDSALEFEKFKEIHAKRERLGK